MDIENIEQKLDQNEKIIQIFSESLPHLSSNNDNSPVLKLFAKQLYLLKDCNKLKHSHLFNRYPNLRIWLKLNNLTSISSNAITSFNKLTFHDLYEKNIDTNELKEFLSSAPFNITNEHDLNNLNMAFLNLKKYYNNLENGISNNTNSLITTPVANSNQTFLVSNYNNSISKQNLNNANSNQYLSSLIPAQNVSSSNQTSLAASPSNSNNFLLYNNTNQLKQLLTPGQKSTPSKFSLNFQTTVKDLNTNNNNNVNSRTNMPFTNNSSSLQNRSDLDLPLNSVFIKSHSQKLQKNNNTNSNSSTNNINSNISNNYNTNVKIRQFLNSNNPNLTGSNLISASATNMKSLTFSPTLQLKSPNKKLGGQKVTTPPPIRKLSTGNPLNVINLNDPQLQAIAKAAAAFYTNNSNNNNIANNINSNAITDPKYYLSSSSTSNNIQRSSSHESHLRSKSQNIQVPQQNQQYLTTTNISPNKVDEPIFPNSNSNGELYESKMSNNIPECNNSKQQYLDKNSNENLNKNNDNYELNSRSPSEHTSPIKSSNMFLINDENSNNNLKTPKSPKPFQEHRWLNNLKVSNCGVCNKKMIIGIKCRFCKYIKYIRIKNIKTCQICHKPLWNGIRCKYCKFRCHKECEKRYTQYCSMNTSMVASLVNNQYSINNENNSISVCNNTNNFFSSASASSSASSSAQPSPALNNLTPLNNFNCVNGALLTQSSSIPYNQNNNSSNSSLTEDNSPQSSTAWSSGATKMARIANKIVDTTLNLVSTPKLTPKSTNTPSLSSFNSYDPSNISINSHQNFGIPKSHSGNNSNHNIESRSSSSCNSSEPNSPNNFKQVYLQQQKQFQLQTLQNQHHYLQQGMITSGIDKKSSSSSISSSYSGNQTQLQTSQFNSSSSKITNIVNNLTPINSIDSYYNSNISNLSPNSSLISQSRTPSSSRIGEFFPQNNSTIEENSVHYRSHQYKADEKSTKEARENLRLAIKKNNNLNVDNNTNDVYNNYFDKTNNSNENLNDNMNFETNSAILIENGIKNDDNEIDTIEQDQYNYSHDFQQFNITYEEITDKVEIGKGRFGVVYKASWHGSIAIKEIDFNDNLTEESEELKKFKEEVLNLRKTRHSNLILFIGACMKPPKCAIVMSLCRGVSLNKYLHSDAYQKPNFDWIIDIATQISQGMGYLHNKHMIHKDLRSKNIFIDGCKAVISDFGLSSITNLCKKLKRRDLLPISKECIYYMAPELIRSIGTYKFQEVFSRKTDVFSFGTIWYEMFAYEYPFLSLHTDTLLYLIGGGLKNISPNIQIPKEFKIILLKCWSSDPSSRPDFSRLLETLRSIPKRTKLFRSPSHPVGIGRSLEQLHHHNNATNELKNINQ